MASKTYSAQRAFRRMNLKLAEGLQEKDCKTIAYLDSLTPLNDSDLNFKVLSSLEAHGYTSPEKVDHLESLLSDIHRLDLLPIITRYKGSKEYKDALEESKQKGREAIRREKMTAARGLESQLSDDNKKIMKSLCSVLISHTTELTKILEILGEILEEEDQEELTKNLKMLAEHVHTTSTAMGTNSQSTRGGEKSTATATKRSTTPLVVKSRKQHSPASTTSHKKPVPLPRSKHTKPPSPLARDYRSLQRSLLARREEETNVGHAMATMLMLPHEEHGYEPKTESEECKSDSEISYDSDDKGCEPSSPVESEYMPLLPRTESNAYTILSHPTCDSFILDH